MMNSGIYKIQNKLNGKIYIGSSKNITKRIQRHKRILKSGDHHNVYLQRSYNKYGDIFEFYILEYVEDFTLLLEKESLWIKELKPEYNIGSVGGGDNISLHPNREEIIKKVTKQLLSARRPSPKFGKDNPNWRGGSSIHYCSCGNTIGYSAKVCRDCVSRNGEANPFYGKTHSEETKKIISEKAKGRPNPSSRKRLRVGEVYFDSATIAAKELGISLGLITYRVKSDKYDYEFVEPEMPND